MKKKASPSRSRGVRLGPLSSLIRAEATKRDQTDAEFIRAAIAKELGVDPPIMLVGGNVAGTERTKAACKIALDARNAKRKIALDARNAKRKIALDARNAKRKIAHGT
jgi:hypothetical protein